MSDEARLAELDGRIREATSGTVVLRNEPMARHTTFGIGGPADIFVQPGGVREFARVLTICREGAFPVLVIGQGSNLIVRDGGIRGVVIQLSRGLSAIKVAGSRIRSEAGATVTELSEAAAQVGLTGLEFAIGIPGSLGGALFMNAGAYDGEIGPLVRWCRVVDESGESRVLDGDKMGFGYRRSVLQSAPLYAVEAELELTSGNPAEIRARMEDYTQRRQAKQPLELPSAGSVFRRPEGHFVGKLVDDAGLRGFRLGGAQVSAKHTGFIVNAGGATARDVLALIAHVQDEVFRRFGVRLQTEVRVVGEEPR